MIKHYWIFSLVSKVSGVLYGLLSIFSKGEQHHHDMITGGVLFATGLLFDILEKLNERTPHAKP